MRTEETLRHAVVDNESKHGADSPQTALALLDLGDFLEVADRFQEAMFCYFRAAALYRRLGPDHALLEALALKSGAEMLKITGKDSRASAIKRKVRNIIYAYTEHGLA